MGHEEYLATMRTGAAVMDGALLLIAGNEKCPQPQTEEHLRELENKKLENIIILQNKLDLIKKEDAKRQYRDILNFIKGTVADGARDDAIIPVSARLKNNINAVCRALVEKIPIPKRNFTDTP